MGKSAPKAPDPYKVSEAQTKSNKETAEYNAALNRIDQSSPFGSMTYSQSGTDPKTGAPLYSQNTTLSPELQSLLQSQMGSQQGISDAITGAISHLPQNAFDSSGINTDKIRDASYSMRVAQMQPQWDDEARSLEGRLSDRGIPIGSEIWNTENDRYEGARNDSLSQISRQSELDAANEYQRQFSNQMTEYNMPLQYLTALMGNSSAVQNPTFSPFAQSAAAGTDVSGNVWNAYKANVDRANSANENMMGGLLGLGKLGVSAFSGGPASAAMGMASMLSDIRLKRDIRRIGALPSGLPVYEFRYLWSDEPMVGVMAQEALGVVPEAVSMHESGFLMVDYSRVV